jgi:hypothetical protein
MEKLTEMLILNLLTNFDERLEHLINISSGHGKEVREENLFFFDSLDMGDVELKMLLEGDRFSFDVDEVILLKGFVEGLHRSPNPAFHFPGTIGKLQSQVNISSLGETGRLFFDQKEGVHLIVLLDFVDQSLHGLL